MYRGHRNPLLSLDVDRTGNIAATGEIHKNPELHIWDARTAQQIFTIKDIHRRGISALNFSASGEFLVSMGQDQMHSIVILRSPSKRWNDGHVVSCTSVSPRKMFWVMYVEGNEYPVVAGGTGTVMFFRVTGIVDRYCLVCLFDAVKRP